MGVDLREELQSALGAGYHLSRELRRGGMSRVFVATDERIGRRVVVKVLPPDLAAAVSIERFKREIHLAGELVHPNIVPVLSAGETSEFLYYTMPLVGGDTLRAIIRRERQLPLVEALGYTSDIASALDFAHAHNTVHRDIKPENILVDHGRALVTDFGIARAIVNSGPDTLTTSGVTLGTPLYMSPEQAAAERHIDGRSDIYSLGCVLYEMLSGEPPFTGGNSRTILARHVQERPPSVLSARPDLPGHVARAIATALAKSPADRFATATEFIAALRQPALSSATEMVGSLPSAQSSTGSRRRWGFLALGGVVAVGALAAALRSRHDERPAPPSPERIAVLYFDSPSGDSTLAALAHGVTRELIASLRTQDFSMVSEAAISRFSPSTPPDSVVRALAVGTIIYGRVDPLPHDSVLATAHMVDAAAVERGWVRVRARRGDPLELLRTVQEQVAETLRVRLGHEVDLRRWQSATASPEAWELRQRAAEQHDAAQQAWQRGAIETARLSYDAEDSLLARAQRADEHWNEPTVARGWVEWSRATMVDPAERRSHIDAALALAERALRRQPGDAAALELRGFLRYQKWQVVEGLRTPALRDSAESDLRRATIADPLRARAWNTYSSLLQDKGDNAAAADAVRRAIDADPYMRDLAQSVSRLFFAYLFAAQYDSAAALCAEFQPRIGRDRRLRDCELNVIGWSRKGDSSIRRAWVLLDTAIGGPDGADAEFWASSRFLVAATIARSRLVDSARDVITSTRRALVSRGAPNTALVNEAHVWATLGAKDSALALLRVFLRNEPGQRGRLARHPWFAPLWNDPRFAAMVGSP